VVLRETIACPTSRLSKSMSKPYYTELHREDTELHREEIFPLSGSPWNNRVSGILCQQVKVYRKLSGVKALLHRVTQRRHRVTQRKNFTTPWFSVKQLRRYHLAPAYRCFPTVGHPFGICYYLSPKGWYYYR